MTITRTLSRDLADRKALQALRLDLDILPAGHADRGRKQQEFNAVKARMMARRGG